jgi:hypothetical protein
MPPPPSIGSARSETGAEHAAARGAEAPSAGSAAGAEPLDDSATSRWSAVDAEIAEDEGPSDMPGSRSLPLAAARPVVPPPPMVGPSSSSSGLRAPSLGPPPSVAVGTKGSAGAAPQDDGWDLDDAPKPAAAPNLGAAKEPGSVPAPKLGAANKEPGSVPGVPKLGAAPKPLPKLGGLRSATPSERAAPTGDAAAAEPSSGDGLWSRAPEPTPSTEAGPTSEPEAWPSFATPSLDATDVDAAAPPSGASLLDALPSFDPPPEEAAADGVPAMDSSALLGVALEPVPDDADAGPSVPRLPMPGMLRDGSVPRAADFRAAPRTPRSPPAAAAMPPLRGVAPPKLREDEEPRLKPGDTAAFVAQVAVELMQEVERNRAEQAQADASSTAEPQLDEERVAIVPREAAAPASEVRPAPVLASLGSAAPPYGSAYPRDERKRRGAILRIGAFGVAAALALAVWLTRDEEPEPAPAPAPTVVASAEAPMAGGAGEAIAKPDPSPPPTDPAKAVPADPVEPGDGGAQAAADDGEPVEAAPSDDDAGAADPTPVEAEGESGGSSRKSGKGSRAGKKPSESRSGGESKPAPTPTPAPKSDDAPSAEKLLKQARSAYNAGKGPTAYSLASKSNRMEPTGEAAEVMALAACQMHDAEKAKSALRTVPLFRRATVRSTCKSKHDVKLGL